MILASNPPRTAEGYWLLDWFAPVARRGAPALSDGAGRAALGGLHRRPEGTAGRLVWVDGPGRVRDRRRDLHRALSRTFIPASLEDNPYRNTPEYRAKLQNLPEPLRSQLLKGDFKAGLQDAPTR
jgi:hypothetical protein